MPLQVWNGWGAFFLPEAAKENAVSITVSRLPPTFVDVHCGKGGGLEGCDLGF